jgi:hypothetical protein
MRTVTILLAVLFTLQTSQFRYELNPGEIIRLSLGRMTSLPNGIVFLGGSYGTLSDPIHTCMLISRDGGRTWTDAQLKYGSAEIGPMVTYGSKMVWALVLFNAEGAESPERLLISRNAGVSWDEVAWKWRVGPGGPLTQVNDFRFLDEKHGLIWLNTSIGKGEVFETSDSGKSWKSVWKTSRPDDADPPASQKDDPAKDIPGSGFFPEVPHTTVSDGRDIYTLRVIDIWRDVAGLVPADEWMSRCPRSQCRMTYAVERLDHTARKSLEHDRPEQWQRISEIPVDYEVVGGTIRPRVRP